MSDSDDALISSGLHHFCVSFNARAELLAAVGYDHDQLTMHAGGKVASSSLKSWAKPLPTAGKRGYIVYVTLFFALITAALCSLIQVNEWLPL